jgi:hypothetical protein
VTPSTHFAEPDRAHRRRAQALGGSFAVTSALLGATVLRLSWRRVEQLQAPLPVDAALVTLTLAAVGLALLALGWTCALGAAAAGAPGIGSVAGAGACRRRPRSARVGALLLALTLATPAAHAGPDRHGVVTSSSAAPHAAVPTGSETEEGQPEAPAPGVPLPGWGDPAPTPTGPATGRPAPERDRCASRGADTSRHVVVTRGDTLWDIAADHLPAGASVAEIAAHWPRWYARNHRTIGSDPDLLLPGQVLRPPTPHSGASAPDPGREECP